MSELSTSNLHSHRCDGCQTVWRHDPDTIPEDKRTEAHTCPNCGTYQFAKHREHAWGEAVPASFCVNGERTIAVPADDPAGGKPERPRPALFRGVEVITLDIDDGVLPGWLW